MSQFTKTDELMRRALMECVFPSASLLVAREDSVVFEEYYGACSKEVIFDIASLTKPVVTTTIAMKAVLKGLLNLDDRVSKFFPEAEHLKNATIFHLLNHSSGLPAWQPYYQEVPNENVASLSGRDQIISAILDEALVYETGTKSVYSDLGFILLGRILENLFSRPLNKLAEEFVTKPLEMHNTFYRIIRKTPWSIKDFEPAYPATERDFSNLQFAPTEDCPWRGGVVTGFVHDQNCYAMGGGAGHAGLFSTAVDLNKFVSEFVSSYMEKGSKYLDKNILEQFVCLDCHTVEPRYHGTFLLGWDRPSHPVSQAGNYFSRNSIGHLGYTGCSLWVDLEKNYWVILLTNRIHPSSMNEKIRGFRPVLHDKIFAELGV